MRLVFSGLTAMCLVACSGKKSLDSGTGSPDTVRPEDEGYGPPSSSSDSGSEPEQEEPEDADSDGYTTLIDCDDDDPEVNPGVDEICNDGKDNDCDGTAQGCEVSLESAETITEGAPAGAALGGALLNGGDLVDDDGMDDVVIGAPNGQSGETQPGAVYILAEGGDAGLVGAVALVGESDGDLAGSALDAGQDYDGDSHADLVIGAPAAVPGGAAYVVLGTPESGSLSLAHLRIRSPNLDDKLGQAVLLNGLVEDSRSEALIGVPGDDGSAEDAGAVLVFRGGELSGDVSSEDAPLRFEGHREGDAMGFALAYGDDIDGDGLTDIIMSAPMASVFAVGQGAVYVHSGGMSGALSADDLAYRWHGPVANAGVGVAIAAIGDVDDDGTTDFAVGAPGDAGEADDAGAVYVVRGGIELESDSIVNVAVARIHGQDEWDGDMLVGVGSVLQGGTDLDGDGIVDISLTIPGEALDIESSIYIVSGAVEGTFSLVDGSSSVARLQTGVVGDGVGSGLAVTGGWDGIPTLLVGAPHSDLHALGAGAVFKVPELEL